MTVPPGTSEIHGRLAEPEGAPQHSAAGPVARVSTREAADLLGVTPSVLMRWERRFGFAASAAMVGQRRTFSIDQLILLGQAMQGREHGPRPRFRPEHRFVPSH